jgi:hypothetical protein
MANDCLEQRNNTEYSFVSPFEIWDDGFTEYLGVNISPNKAGTSSGKYPVLCKDVESMLYMHIHRHT